MLDSLYLTLKIYEFCPYICRKTSVIFLGKFNEMVLTIKEFFSFRSDQLTIKSH